MLLQRLNECSELGFQAVESYPEPLQRCIGSGSTGTYTYASRAWIQGSPRPPAPASRLPATNGTAPLNPRHVALLEHQRSRGALAPSPSGCAPLSLLGLKLRQTLHVHEFNRHKSCHSSASSPSPPGSVRSSVRGAETWKSGRVANQVVAEMKLHSCVALGSASG